jgi:hypothetical protein
MSFINFNPATVVHQGVARRNLKTPVKDKNGAIRLLSGEMQVVNAVVSEDGIEIICKNLDPLFADHVSTLERVVFRMFNPQAVTKHIIDQDSQLRLFFTRFALELQANKGYTCLKAKKGEALNIEEDLMAGDVIQMMYTMQVNCSRDTRVMELKPIKIIKNNEYVVKEDELVEANNSEQIADAAAVATTEYDEPVIVVEPIKKPEPVKKPAPKAPAAKGKAKAKAAPVRKASPPRPARKDLEVEVNSDDEAEHDD